MLSEHSPQFVYMVENKKAQPLMVALTCDSCRIQTCNLLIRSQMLYSVELRSHPFCFCECKITTIICNHQIFLQLFFLKQ